MSAAHDEAARVWRMARASTAVEKHPRPSLFDLNLLDDQGADTAHATYFSGPGAAPSFLGQSEQLRTTRPRPSLCILTSTSSDVIPGSSWRQTMGLLRLLSRAPQPRRPRVSHPWPPFCVPNLVSADDGVPGFQYTANALQTAAVPNL